MGFFWEGLRFFWEEVEIILRGVPIISGRVEIFWEGLN